MFAKMNKLENYLEHARTQEIPISAKEDQLLRLKLKLKQPLNADQEDRVRWSHKFRNLDKP